MGFIQRHRVEDHVQQGTDHRGGVKYEEIRNVQGCVEDTSHPAGSEV